MATTIGRLSIEAIYDGTLIADPPSALLPGPTAVDWEDHADLLNSDGLLELGVGGFLVRGYDDRIVLIDTGYGADHPLCGKLKASLRAAGVKPAQVTDVVFTHLHQDHIGGVIERGMVSFPNATYRCHVADWTYFAEPRGADRAAPDQERLSVLRGRLEPWDSNVSIFPGFDVVHAPGHTPGSSVIVLSGDQQRLMLLGDVVHCALQLLESEWSTLYDVDPELAVKTRRNLVREVEGGTTLVTGGHFPGLSFGRLLEGRGKARFTFDRSRSVS
jgi:glyoxylase-like metal-dependent hydrolase (beta-lactamase superfamily II)